MLPSGAAVVRDVNPSVGSRGLETESSLKARIRGDLPAEAFARHPWRLLLGIPLILLIPGVSVAMVILPLPWYVALAGSIVVGSLYASFFFFGHEAGHGAMVRSPRLQEAVLYASCLIYCLSPHLWMIWHNHAHHGHTNMPEHDPDTFGTLEEFRQRRFSRFFGRFAPGSGHWLSAFYLPTFFSLHSQGVLWVNSFRPPFRRLNRPRAIIDSVGMAAFWLGVSLWAGPRGTLFAVLIPMLMVNFVMMSYVVTNHMLRRLAPGPDSLATTMSVSTFKFLDLLFFNFSHHVEHHLFPSMSPRYYPLVRRSLYRHAGDRYLAPSHWRALRLAFRTPRLYADAETLVQPTGDHRVSLAAVEAAIRGAARRPVPATARGDR
jgi:fatty acid desaturase